MTDHEVSGAGPPPGRPASPANPAQLVVDGVQRCLALAASWQAWDGQPIARGPGGPDNTWLTAGCGPEPGRSRAGAGQEPSRTARRAGN